MLRACVALVLCLVCMPCVPAVASQRVSLDGEWRFWVDTQNHVPIQVPFTNEPREALTAYQKLFTVPPGACDGLVLLRFDGVVGTATVYLNGVELGQHGSYTPFWFSVSSLLDTSGENDLIVTIDDRRDVTTVPYEDIPWVNYSGIMRSVYLECADQAVLLATEPQYDFTGELTHVDGEVFVQAAGTPGTEVSFAGALLDGSPGNWTTVALLDSVADVPVGPDGLASATLSFSADGLELWSPDAPRLYHLYVVAEVDGQPADERLAQTGFRDIRVEGKDILLNGEPFFLKGVSRHDIYPDTGFVGTDQQILDDLSRLKAAGANYVRTIHSPTDPRVLDLADQMGLLISEEVPAWANFWDPDVRVKLYTLLEEMIRRDMHHPSVFLWVSGNARAHPMPYALEATQLAKSLDRNRLVSYVIDNDEYTPEVIAEDVAFVQGAQLDLYMKISWWFYYVEYLQDAWTNFPKDLPIVIAEFGREGNDREPIAIDGEQTFWWGEDQQADAVAEMLEAWRPHLPPYDADEHITGMVLFNYQDFDWPGIQVHLPTHIPSVHHGLVYEDRVPKLALQTLTDFYSTLPTEYVGLPTPDDSEVERLFAAPAGLGPPVNQAFRDSGASLNADGGTLYFVSDGPDHVHLPKIYFSEWVDDHWSAPQLVDMPQETEPLAYRAAPCISPDGQTLYFARALVNGIYVEQTRIRQSRFVDGAWSEPEDLGDVINDPDPARITTDPEVSADGNTLFFSSDRPGGQGRSDLWVSAKVDGTWSEPVNLGLTINTEHGETGPSISADGLTLYFSSDRPGGVGSSDIWVSHYADGQWTTPKNLGPDVNSPGSDREPMVSHDGQHLFFTGIRAGGEGLADLWVAGTSSAPVPVPVGTISGLVLMAAGLLVGGVAVLRRRACASRCLGTGCSGPSIRSQ